MRFQSERIFFSADLVFREWDDRIPSNQAYEFRGFVNNNTLNAVTQYNSDTFFPEVVETKDILSNRIQTYFSEISSLIPHHNYVIDFILFPNGENKIIEINPFATNAGTGLFSWENDKDLIMNGPFEFRVLDHLPENSSNSIHPDWIKYLYEIRSNRFSLWKKCFVS